MQHQPHRRLRGARRGNHLDAVDHCVYLGSFFPGNLLGPAQRVQVIDVADPANPVLSTGRSAQLVGQPPLRSRMSGSPSSPTTRCSMPSFSANKWRWVIQPSTERPTQTRVEVTCCHPDSG